MNVFILSLIFTLNAMSFVVLIDPGHGGEELGAVKKVRKKVGKKIKTITLYEKDLALKLSKILKKKLDPFYTTYLTRSFDRTVGLDERADMADAVKADLFISIHFNSSTHLKSHGFETYYLNNHRDAAIKKVEHIENKFLKGSDKIVNQILIDLVISKTVVDSENLAKKVHENISKSVGKKYKRRNRGVKPGLFYVLALSKRPGILIEAGFMSHHKEIWKIQRKDYLEDYADGIAQGVKEYFKGKKDQDILLF